MIKKPCFVKDSPKHPLPLVLVPLGPNLTDFVLAPLPLALALALPDINNQHNNHCHCHCNRHISYNHRSLHLCSNDFMSGRRQTNVILPTIVHCHLLHPPKSDFYGKSRMTTILSHNCTPLLIIIILVIIIIKHPLCL